MPDGSDISKKVKAGPISADRLKAFVERIEKLLEQVDLQPRQILIEAKILEIRLEALPRLSLLLQVILRRLRLARSSADVV